MTALAAAFVCAAACAASAQEGRVRPLPTYEVLRASSPIKVDGRPDEAAWHAAKSVGPFVRNRDGAAAPVETEAKVLYDERFLYFSFRVEDENVWATMRRRDQHLWHEEVVEVFLQADRGVPNYIELEVNPLGTLLDIYLLDRRRNLPYESWNSAGLKWAVRVEGKVDGRGGDRGWTCEIALPLEDVATAPSLPPRPGDRWRMNLYRVENRPEPLGLAWSPTLEGDFHVPPMFGEIIFSGRSVP
ncbi:MAG TPA: carbohydrate-binding family 9-like protein [Pyrinomonadaceae bacterium]